MSDCDQIPVTKLLCVMNHVARSPHGFFFFVILSREQKQKRVTKIKWWLHFCVVQKPDDNDKNNRQQNVMITFALPWLTFR